MANSTITRMRATSGSNPNISFSRDSIERISVWGDQPTVGECGKTRYRIVPDGRLDVTCADVGRPWSGNFRRRRVELGRLSAVGGRDMPMRIHLRNPKVLGLTGLVLCLLL